MCPGFSSRHLREVEQKHFRVVHALDAYALLIADCRAIALLEFIAVHFHCTARNLEPPVTSISELVPHFFARLEQRDVELRILVDLDRALSRFPRRNHT